MQLGLGGIVAAMPFGISLPELLILLVVLLLVFGAKRLPEMGRSLGKGMREFKDGVSGLQDDDSEPARAELPATTSDSFDDIPPDPDKVRAALDSLSDDDRRAIVESLESDTRKTASGTESEREAVS